MALKRRKKKGYRRLFEHWVEELNGWYSLKDLSNQPECVVPLATLCNRLTHGTYDDIWQAATMPKFLPLPYTDSFNMHIWIHNLWHVHSGKQQAVNTKPIATIRDVAIYHKRQKEMCNVCY